MAEWTLKYADARGAMHQQVAQADSERELRDRFTEQGYLVYSIRPREGAVSALRPRGKKLNLQKFLIFNQQFVTLIRAGLPILKGLDLLAERLTDPSYRATSKAFAKRSGTERSCPTPSPARASFRRFTSPPFWPVSVAARFPTFWNASSLIRNWPCRCGAS